MTVEHLPECPRATEPEAAMTRLDCPACAKARQDRGEWQLGDRCRTSFDGEVYPGVYEIVGISDEQAQLESDQCTKTWCPVVDLVPADDAPPPDALSIRQTNQVTGFAQFIAGLDHARCDAALALLKGLICIHCGTQLTEKRPVCFCTRDE